MTEKDSGQKKRLTFDLPVEVHRQFKMKAFKQGLTIKRVLQDLVANYVKNEE